MERVGNSIMFDRTFLRLVMHNQRCMMHYPINAWIYVKVCGCGDGGPEKGPPWRAATGLDATRENGM